MQISAANEIEYPYYPFRLKVDYVLVSRVDHSAMQQHRAAFERAARKEGLILNNEVVESFQFTLISTPFHRLCREAERTVLYFPLKNCMVEHAGVDCFTRFTNSLLTTDKVSDISVPFQFRFAESFLHFEDDRRFFSSAQRSLLTHQILAHLDVACFLQLEDETQPAKQLTLDGRQRRASVLAEAMRHEHRRRAGLPFLLMEGAYADAFILHDPSEKEPFFKRLKDNDVIDFEQWAAEMDDDPRCRLSSVWQRWTRAQPLNLVRDYFGEQIAFYFAWQGTFCTMLWPAALVGIAVFIYGLVTSIHEAHPVGACFSINSTGGTETRPQSECSTRTIITNIFNTVSSFLMSSFDSDLTAFYAAFMSIWGSVLCQIWKRNSAVLCSQWDAGDVDEDEPDRPQYSGSAMQTDAVTGEPEWVQPYAQTLLRGAVSTCVVASAMAAVALSVILVILFKLFVLQALECKKEMTLGCWLAGSLAPSLLNTVSTMLLGYGYTTVARRLTDWENHRTQSQHMNSLIWKLFSFQFVNNYTSLFYIAFVRPDQNNLQPNGLFGLGPQYKDTCEEGTCGSLLALQLILHILIKPFPKFTKDIIIPYLTRIVRLLLWRRRVSVDGQGGDSLEEKLRERSENYREQSVLVREWLKPDAGDFALGEFTEKMLQFGTTVMFAALFPLAPLLALIIGVADIRIDASRLLWFNRRPVPVRVDGIGFWMDIFTFLQYAAVITNSFIVAFTSNFCPKFLNRLLLTCSLQNRLLIVIVFQNATVLLKFLLQAMMTATPEDIKIAQRRKRYVARYVSENGSGPDKVFKNKSQRVKLAWMKLKRQRKEKKIAPVSSNAT